MKYLISFLFLALAFSMKSEAKVTLPSILGDNMVLQQQAEVKLWGKARPNATVTVKTSWNGQTYKFSSDGKGGWSLTVSTLLREALTRSSSIRRITDVAECTDR